MSTKGNLKPNDFQIIQKNYVYLKHNLDANYIVDYLFQQNVISLEDKEKIGSSKSTLERNEIMLMALLHAGPGEAFNHFLQSLDACYKHIREHLEQSAKTLVKMEDQVDEIVQLKEEQGKNFVKMEVEDGEIFHLKDELAKAHEELRVAVEDNVLLQNHCTQAHEKLEDKVAEIEKLKEQNAQANRDLESEKATILKLKEENAYEAIRMKNKEINRLIKLEDFQRCMEVAIKGRRLDEKGKAAFWETEQPRLNRKGCPVPPKIAMALSGTVYLNSEYEEWITRQFSGAGLEKAIIGFLSEIGLSITEWVLFKEEYINYQNYL